MSKHPWAKLSLKQIYANTRALKRIRKEMEENLIQGHSIGIIGGKENMNTYQNWLITHMVNVSYATRKLG